MGILLQLPMLLAGVAVVCVIPGGIFFLSGGRGGVIADLEGPTEIEGADASVIPAPSGEPIRVGILHSLTGTMADSEQRALHVPDGIHLNDLGQLAMAYAILKGLGADRLVSALSLDAVENQIVSQQRCEARELSLTSKGGSFVRLDQSLPFNNGPFAALNYGFVPIGDMNAYELQVTHLDEGDYDLVVDGRGVGRYSADQLSQGVGIASSTSNGFLPGGPWDAQANVIKQLTEARSQLGAANGQRIEYFGDDAWSTEAGEQSADIDGRFYELQRRIARPRPYRFVLTPAQPSSSE